MFFSRHTLSALCAAALPAFAPSIAEAAPPVVGVSPDGAIHAPLDWLEVATPPQCDPSSPLPARTWLDSISTPGRSFTEDERHNAEVIYETFREQGLEKN